MPDNVCLLVRSTHNMNWTIEGYATDVTQSFGFQRTSGLPPTFVCSVPGSICLDSRSWIDIYIKQIPSGEKLANHVNHIFNNLPRGSNELSWLPFPRQRSPCRLSWVRSFCDADSGRREAKMPQTAPDRYRPQASRHPQRTSPVLSSRIPSDHA